MMFTVLDQSNTARVTLTDSRPNTFHTQTILTLAEPQSIAAAVLGYSILRRMPAREVQTSIIYPEGRCTASKA